MKLRVERKIGAGVDGIVFHFGCLPTLQSAQMEVSAQAKYIGVLLHCPIESLET